QTCALPIFRHAFHADDGLHWSRSLEDAHLGVGRQCTAHTAVCPATRIAAHAVRASSERCAEREGDPDLWTDRGDPPDHADPEPAPSTAAASEPHLAQVFVPRSESPLSPSACPTNATPGTTVPHRYPTESA